MQERKRCRYYEWDKESFLLPADLMLSDRSELADALRVFYCAGGYDFFVSRSRSCMRPVGLCFWESCMRGLWRAGMPAAERIMPFLWMKCRKQNWQSVAFQRFFSETVRFHDHVRYTIKVSTFTQDCALAALIKKFPYRIARRQSRVYFCLSGDDITENMIK